MWVQHLTSLQFLTYVAFFAVAIAAVMRFLPGAPAPVRTEPYDEEELGRHDRRLGKYFVAGGGFLVLGGVHMVLKNLPWTAEWLAGAGYAGHLVRDLSNTHVMIVGGGTLLATGLCWWVLPRIVGRPLASEGLAQYAFWLTAVGLLVFYVALVADGIAISRLVEHGWDYQAAKAHMGKWYKLPVGVGAGVMGLGYWCFAANVCLTIFQARLVRVAKPLGHLWKFVATGALALTVGTVQGVIQVQPAKADWLYRAGHAGEWIDPISHAHINLVTGLAMLAAGALLALAPQLGGETPSRPRADACFWTLLVGSLAFYGSCLYLGFHEGRLVVRGGLSPERGEEVTRLHAPLIVGSGVLMFAAFWFLLATLLRAYRTAAWPLRSFVYAGCAALAVGTLQGPIQALPAVNELLDRGGDAGDLIVNLHAQLNMLGGLMVLLIGAVGGLLQLPTRRMRTTLIGVPVGMGVYYAAGIAFAALEAHAITRGRSFPTAVATYEPWQALVLIPAALAVLAGFAAYARTVWAATAEPRAEGRRALRLFPRAFSGRIPARVVRRPPASVAAYEVPMGVLGFPGVGWLFAGYPLQASVLLLVGPAFAWAVLPAAFTPFGHGPLRGIGWQVELFWLPVSTALSATALYLAHRRRRRAFLGPPPGGGRRRRRANPRLRIGATAGTIALMLVSLPFVAAVGGIGSGGVRYSYLPHLTSEITGQFLSTQRGPVKLFSWSDPQEAFPPDALRIHARDVRALTARAAALDAAAAYRLYDLDRDVPVPLQARRAGPRELRLTPKRRLEPSRYVYTASHEGMFGGRDYAYLEIVPPGAPTTPIASGGGRAPTIAHALPPVAATLLALAFALLLLRSFRARPAGQKAFWAAGFLLFAAATAAEAIAQHGGWTPALFRTYYLCGGILAVAYLGTGSAWLLLPPRGRDWLLGGLATATLAAVVTVALAQVDSGTLARAAGGRPPANGAIAGHAFLWAATLNSLGTLALVGGSLLAIARRIRVRENLWIAGGAAVVALATGISRTGDYSFVYLGQLAGLALMFCGFTLPSRGSATRRQPQTRTAHPATTVH
jgi:cytochrome c oxidase cbb3-type subunit 1